MLSLGLGLERPVCSSLKLGGQICVNPCCADVPRRRIAAGVLGGAQQCCLPDNLFSLHKG